MEGTTTHTHTHTRTVDVGMSDMEGWGWRGARGKNWAKCKTERWQFFTLDFFSLDYYSREHTKNKRILHVHFFLF